MYPTVFKQAQYFRFKLQNVWLYFMFSNITFEWKENYLFTWGGSSLMSR